MHFSCRPIDASFFDTAPMRFVNAVDLNASPEKVFAFFADSDSWPKWFPAIRKAQWTSEKPYGVGSTRTGWLPPTSVDEHFFRWEPNRRCSFYATGTSAPMAHA